MSEHVEIINGVTYALSIEPEDAPVRGNAMASGDDAFDREVEDAILARLEAGDQWAWCGVVVTASVEVEGETFEGRDTLGSCSYSNAAEFMAGGYWEDMLDQAWSNLRLVLAEAVKRGHAAQSLLDEAPAPNRGKTQE